MKKGFWNYTEPTEYRVVLVRLAAVADPPLAWQNAFAGQTRQAVEVTDQKGYKFYIDNGDGSGLDKAESRGGPGQMSRHIQPGAFEIVAQVDEAQWQRLDAQLWRDTDAAVEAWQKANHPQEYERLQALREAWASSRLNPKNVK